jgi:hypothetical protein
MEYRPIRVADILNDLNRTTFLPDIQREFVWKPHKVELLFDSVMRDFPIGSFLFWKLDSKNKNDWNIYEFSRDFDEENPHNKQIKPRGDKDIHLVVDGQQRISSFFIGLRGSYRYLWYRWRSTKLFLNLLKKPLPNEEEPEEPVHQFSFREENPINREGEYWFEVGKILNYADAEDAKADIIADIAYLDEELKSDALKMLGKLHARIHTIPIINYYEEKTQDYEKVLQIFVRVNSEGVHLEYSDLLLSTATAKWENLNAKEEIHGFTDSINKIGNGYQFGKDFVLKGALYLTKDLPIQYKVKNFNKRNLKKIEDNWLNIKNGLEDTIKLVSKFGFSNKNITATMALLPIAYYLNELKKKNYVNSSDKNDVKNQNEIRKWLILVLLKGSFGGSSDTTLNNLRIELQKVKDYSVFPIGLLNKRLSIDSNFSDEEIRSFLFTKYATRYSYLILSLLYPDRDWKDNTYHEDHIFPKSQFTSAKLRDRGYDDQKIDEYQDHYNTILNLQLLTDTENREKYSSDFNTWISTRDDNYKERHKIPMLKSYDFDNFMEFISERKKILESMLKTV